MGSKESDDCGICTNCQDKPKFGGPGRKKLCEQRCKHYVMMMLCSLFFFKYHFAICDTGTQIAKVKATVLSPSLNTFTLPNPYPTASKQVLKCLLENMPGSYLLHLEYTSVVPHPVLQQMSRIDQWSRDFTVYNVSELTGYPACLCVLHVLDRTG